MTDHPLGSVTDALRLDALRAAAQARIDRLRAELAGTRLRNKELIAEIDARSQRDAANQPPSLGREPPWIVALRGTPTFLQDNPDGGWLGRQMRRVLRLAYWGATFQLPQRYRLWRQSVLPSAATPQPPLAHFRAQDASWLEPWRRQNCTFRWLT